MRAFNTFPLKLLPFFYCWDLCSSPTTVQQWVSLQIAHYRWKWCIPIEQMISISKQFRSSENKGDIAETCTFLIIVCPTINRKQSRAKVMSPGSTFHLFVFGCLLGRFSLSYCPAIGLECNWDFRLVLIPEY